MAWRSAKKRDPRYRHRPINRPVYAGVRDGIYVRSRHGRQWARLGRLDREVGALEIDRSERFALWAGTLNNGVHRFERPETP